jgi:hypothetical protein
MTDYNSMSTDELLKRIALYRNYRSASAEAARLAHAQVAEHTADLIALMRVLKKRGVPIPAEGPYAMAEDDPQPHVHSGADA